MQKILLVCDNTASSSKSIALGYIDNDSSVTIISPDDIEGQPAHNAYDQIIIDTDMSDSQIQSVIAAMRKAGVCIPITISPSERKSSFSETGNTCVLPAMKNEPVETECSGPKCGELITGEPGLIAGAACVYPHLFDGLESGVIIISREGICVYSNNRIKMIVGEHIAQRHVNELFGDSFPANHSSSDCIRFDTNLYHARSGKEFRVHVEAMPISEKCSLGWYILVSELDGDWDNSEPVDMSGQQLMPPEFPETLMDRLAHEVRTPAALIKESIELIAEQYLGDVNEMQKKYLKVAQENIGRLVNAINLMLEHTSSNSVIAKLDVQECDINDMLRGIISTLKELYPDLNEAIRLQHPANVLVKTDSAKLAYILYTLLDMLVAGPADVESLDVAFRNLDLHVLIIIHTRYRGGEGMFHTSRNCLDALEICKVLIWLLKGSIIAESQTDKRDGCLKIMLPLEYETEIWRNET